ncbi:MAG: hypothetical protein IPJ65_02090 [Archangiaceae bacterium]|nr:hypothetical protein [Archangiaceae bacterium]
MTTSFRLSVVAFALAVVSCGGAKDICGACGEGTLCDTASGKCIAKMNMGTQCMPACSGAKGICDNQTNPQSPVCVQCLSNAQCSGGATCSSNHNCIGGGTGGGSGTAGGSGLGGGTAGSGGAGGFGGSGGSAGGGAVGGGPAGGPGGGTGGSGGSGGSAGGFSGAGGGWVFADAGLPYNGIGSCAPQDAGVASCTPNCAEGFHCQGGLCVLNGGGGPVQVTLRWNTIEDLDLHLLEPRPGGATCEISYDDDNQPGNPSSCGAMGSLDLDSEAACPSPPDNVNIENIIYPAGATAPSGTYTVWVNHYENCDTSLTMVPFELEVRFNGNLVGVCGVFVPTDSDWNDGDGTDTRFMMTFNVP